MAFLILGLLVIVLGLGLVFSHVLVWRKQREKPNVELTELRAQRWQYRRRVLTSGLMAAVGLLVVIGQTLDKKEHPQAYISIWLIIILITAVMIILALMDYTVTRRRLNTKLVILEAKRRQLEKEARLLRQQQEGNHELN
ncbi:MAG: hypothetical protein CMJ46_16550 [Planctomyces sp.]|nr:hypothetical protein [Planctomyces sp.]